MVSVISIAKGLTLAGEKIAFNCHKEEYMKQTLENYKKRWCRSERLLC